jgi:hypothetical protein
MQDGAKKWGSWLARNKVKRGKEKEKERKVCTFTRINKRYKLPSKRTEGCWAAKMSFNLTFLHIAKVTAVFISISMAKELREKAFYQSSGERERERER